MKRLITICAVVGLMLAVLSPALATTVTLVPSTLDVNPGSTVDISVNIDVSSSITMTAISTDFVYDKNVFTYDGTLGATQGALLTHDWDLLGAQTATLRIGGIDWFGGGENFVVGSGTLFTFTLKVSNDAPIGSYDLVWGDAGNGVGFDYGDENFGDIIPPSFGTSINVVPEPATMCLFGLGSLSLIRRKR